jgi:hypothetical protein
MVSNSMHNGIGGGEFWWMGWKPNNNAIECWLKWPKNILLSFEI